MAGCEIDWVGVFGIIGTLGGVIVGAGATYRIQERQLKHSDETRFQEQRMGVYTEFTSSANRALSHWVANSHDPGSVDDFIRCFETVRMVGTASVISEATEVHRLFGELMRAEDKTNLDDRTRSAFQAAIARFVKAARIELRVRDA